MSIAAQAGSVRRFSAEAALAAERPSRWSAQVIVQQLRRLHKARQPMWSRKLRVSHSALYSAAIHCFGSYREAVTASGVDYRSVQQLVPGRWNRQSVCRELRRLHRAKEPLHHAVAEQKHPDLVLAAYRYFGSYGKAVDAAGLNYSRIRVREMPSWDRKRVLGRIKELERSDAGLWSRAVRRVEPYLERAAARTCGSYQRAVRLVGVSRGRLQPPPYRIWSPARIISDLQALHRRNPKLLKPGSLIESHPKLLRACRRQLGTYAKALEAAGISYQQVVRPDLLTGPEVVQRLTHLFERGKDLRYSYMRRTAGKIFHAAVRCFGSYEKAINAAGLDYPPPAPVRHWTAGLVLKQLQDHSDKGKDLRWRQFRKANLPLYQAAKHYFGTYPAALKKAGINYQQMVQAQLRRQLPRRRQRVATSGK
jgi:hypothetical protein